MAGSWSGGLVQTVPGRRTNLASRRQQSLALRELNRQMARDNFSENGLQVDGGPFVEAPERASIRTGIGLRAVGEAQVAKRAAELKAERKATNAALDPRDRVYGYGNDNAGGLPTTSGMDAFAGLLQAKANAAESAGMRFRVHPEDALNLKAEDVLTGRTYDLEHGEIAPGMRQRPPAGYAAETGQSPKQGGFYAPDELSRDFSAHGGLREALSRTRDSMRMPTLKRRR